MRGTPAVYEKRKKKNLIMEVEKQGTKVVTFEELG